MRSAGDEADWADILMALPDWWVERELEGGPPNAQELGLILRYVAESAKSRRASVAAACISSGRKVIAGKMVKSA